jgi:Zn-dependent protease with chaperone function
MVTVVERGGDGGEEAGAIRANRRKAMRMCAVPGLVAGVIVGAVVIAVGVTVVLGVVAFIVVAAIVVVWMWRSAPGALLRAVGARPSHEWELPRLYNLVDGLCATMGLPGPAICVVDSPVPNAMAVGHDPAHASLVVTSALETTLTLVELEGVLAHELVHIKRHDTVLAGVAVVTTAPLSALTGVAKGADRVHRIVGRGREFDADQRAARVVRYPPGIGSALDAMLEGDGVLDGHRSSVAPAWPPGRGRTAAITRWLWIDPMVGAPAGEPMEGNLDDTRVRAEALSLY